MKIRNTFNTRSLSLGAMAVMAVMASANAATIAKGEFQVIGDTNSADLKTNPGISVTSGSEGYSTGVDGIGTGGLDGTFNGAILDYGFYARGTGTVISEVLGGAALLINTPTHSGTAQTDPLGIDIWATTTPSITPNGNNSPITNADLLTYSRPGNVTGTVDISGLASGSLYMFFGTRVDANDVYGVTFTLSGAGQPVVPTLSEIDITQFSQGGTANNGWFVYRADFEDAADYDLLTYTYARTTGNNQARSRFGGVVLTAVPEPSTALLGGLGVLFLLRRRRI